MKLASVYYVRQRLIFRPCCQTVEGAWIGADDVRIITGGGAPEDIGNAVCWALSMCERGVAQPITWKEDLFLLKASGCDNWDAFEQTATFCHVQASPESIEIIPYVNSEDNRCFVPSDERLLRLPVQADPVEIGTAIADWVSKKMD